MRTWNPCRDSTSAALEAGKAAILADIADIAAYPDEWSFSDGSREVLTIYLEQIDAELTRRSRLRLPPERRPNQSADAIKAAIDLVQVVERYVVGLRRCGTQYRAKCPLHHGESDTSLSINPEKQVWFCHGCLVGGDVFDFLMWVAGCDFPGALELACIEAGIPKPAQRDTTNFPSYPNPLRGKESWDKSKRPIPHAQVIGGKVVDA